MASAYVFGALRDDEPPPAGRREEEEEEETDSMEQESCEASRDPPGPPGNSQVEETAEMRMFLKVISSNRIIKSQQRDEPDLTSEQKIEVLDDLLRKKPGAFLMRFGQLLDDTDLTFFDAQRSSNYEIEFRVKQLRKNLSSKAKKKQTKNRRYTALMELADTSQYFSDQEMRERNPLLFEEYIGQYLTEEEKASLDSDKSEMSLSAHIMRKMDIDKRRELLRRQRRELEGSAVEEEEEEDSSSEDESGSGVLSSDATVTAQEKWMMRQEFLRVMQLSFLTGKDKDFDYSKVDLNEKYDSLEMRQRDEEDSYFDAEQPSLCEEEDGTISRDCGEEGGGEMDDQ